MAGTLGDATLRQNRLDRARGQTRRCNDEEIPERGPKRTNPVIQRQMLRERPVSLVDVGVKFNVLHEEMPEAFEQWRVPLFCFEDRAEYVLQTAALIAGDAHRPDVSIELADVCKVPLARDSDSVPHCLIDRIEVKHAPHEFVMVHFFAGSRDTRPWRQIVRIAFFPREVLQHLIVGMNGKGRLQVFAELDRKIIISPCSRGQFVRTESCPIHAANFCDNHRMVCSHSVHLLPPGQTLVFRLMAASACSKAATPVKMSSAVVRPLVTQARTTSLPSNIATETHALPEASTSLTIERTGTWLAGIMQSTPT